VLTPVIAREATSERVQVTLRTFRMLVLATAFSLVVAAAAGPFLLPFAFGADYDGAVVPFLWLLPGALGYAAMTAFSSALIASSAPGRSSLGPLVALVVGLVLDVILIPTLDADGAAIASSGAFILGGLVALVAYRRLHAFSLDALIPRRDDVSRFGLMARSVAHGTAGNS
jgi:O-antigen/teichoic acid export membrane protein